MRIAGHYAEFWPSAAGVPEGSVKDFATTSRVPDADSVVRYLHDGCRILSVMSIDPDVFDPTEDVMGGSSVLTDGVWVWRHSLAYYFHRYHLRLSPEFLARVRNLHCQRPPVSAERMKEITDQLKAVLVSRTAH